MNTEIRVCKHGRKRIDARRRCLDCTNEYQKTYKKIGREANRKLHMCRHCGHFMFAHDPSDEMRCYHRNPSNRRAFDCECTGGEPHTISEFVPRLEIPIFGAAA